MKKLLITSIPLIIVIILFVIVGKFGITKVIDLRTKIASSQKDLKVLDQKLNLLTSISKSVAENAGVALNALPDTNPSLIITSQIKTIAANNVVVVSGAKSGSSIEDTSELSHVNISFQATGTRPQIMAFLKNIALIAPITLIDKVKMVESGDSVRADVTIKSFWAALPKNLPTLTSPITDLTPAEKKILTNISGLIQPVFLDIPATEGDNKPDPFSQ